MTVIKRFLSLFFAAVVVFSACVFFAPKAGASENKITIVIDPGHGGAKDPGTAYSGVGEKDMTLRLALSLRDKLEATGRFSVILTRSSDVPITLANRVKIAYDNDADLLFSIHFDGSAASNSRGTTAYTSVFDEFELTGLGNAVTSRISSYTGFRNNGTIRKRDTEGYYWNAEKQWDMKDPSLGVLSDYYGIPTWGCKFGIKTLLVEHGYFTNPTDVSFIFSDIGIDTLAQADADAIFSYYTDHAHAFGAEQVDCPSNCAYQGKSSSHCSICGARQNVKTLPAAPEAHFYYTVGTSENAGYCDSEEGVTYICRISENLNEKGIYCPDHTNYVISKPKTEHNYVVTYHVDRGHTTDGVTTYSCTKCPSEYTETVPAEGHTWLLMHHTEPDCENAGYNTYTCPECRENRTEELPALGHSFVRTSLIKEQSCTEAGEETVRCTVCAFETSREIPPTGHRGWLMEHVDSACSVQGYDKYHCNICGEEYIEYIDMPEHSFVLSEQISASCDCDGKNVFTCEVCGTVNEETTEKGGHKFEETFRKEAACESTGEVIYTCSACGEEKTEILPMKGHVWGEGKTIRKTGFIINGIERFICLNDSAHINDVSLPSKFTKDSECRLTVILTPFFVMLSLALSFLEKYGVLSAQKTASLARALLRSGKLAVLSLKQRTAHSDKSEADSVLKTSENIKAPLEEESDMTKAAEKIADSVSEEIVK